MHLDVELLSLCRILSRRLLHILWLSELILFRNNSGKPRWNFTQRCWFSHLETFGACGQNGGENVFWYWLFVSVTLHVINRGTQWPVGRKFECSGWIGVFINLFRKRVIKLFRNGQFVPLNQHVLVAFLCGPIAVHWSFCVSLMNTSDSRRAKDVPSMSEVLCGLTLSCY